MRIVSPTFLREYRKQFLTKTGEVLPGMQTKADLLLELMRLAQSGREYDVIEIGYYNGLDLRAMYRDYLRERQVVNARSKKVWALQVLTRSGWRDAITSKRRIEQEKVKRFERRGIQARIVRERRAA